MATENERVGVAFLVDSGVGEMVEVSKGPNGDVSFETDDRVLCRVWPDQLKKALVALGFDEFTKVYKRK